MSPNTTALSPPTTVAQYLAALPADRRAILAVVRAAINAHLPRGYEETLQSGMISWVVPAAHLSHTYNGQPLPLVSLGAQKNHLALYLLCVYSDPSLSASFTAAWARTGKPLDMGKSCLRFTSLDDLVLDAITSAIAAVPIDAYVAQYERNRSKTVKQKPVAGAQPTRKPAGGARPTRKPAGGAQLTRKPAGAAQLTRKPAGDAQPTRKPAARAQPTRKPAGGAQPTRKTAGGAQLTRKPAGRAQPTRKPAGDAQPTRKPAAGAQPTRKPAAGTQPTRKPAARKAAATTSNAAVPARKPTRSARKAASGTSESAKRTQKS